MCNWKSCMWSECRVFKYRRIVHMWMSTRKEIWYGRGEYPNCPVLTLFIVYFYLTLLKGFDGDGYSCADINECETECDLNAECINTVGSFTCECKQGKRWNLFAVTKLILWYWVSFIDLSNLFVYFYLDPLKRFWRRWFLVLRYKRMCNWRSWLRFECVRVY